MSENFSISEPSYNISDTGLKGCLDFYQKNTFAKIEKTTPAKIISYDRVKNRATVQILNYAITSVGDKVPRKEISDIPVFCFGSGNFVLSFPVKVGDIGFISSADGDISVFKKILDFFAPATYEKHRYKDGIFYPIIFNGFTFSETDTNSVLISSLDGTTKISLSEGKAEITAVNTVINSENTTFNGNILVNGDITASGTVTGQTKIISGNGSTGTYTNSVTAADGIVTGGS